MSADPKLIKKLHREQATISKMLAIYCRAKHGTKANLCEQCQEMETYAHQRLEHCIFMPEKPTCARCPVHCYQEPYRDAMREVMRFAGPRMLLVDPAAAVRHLASMFQRESPKVIQLRETMERKAKND